MIISPYTPLTFYSESDPKLASDGIASRYIQTFASTDTILLEIIGDAIPQHQPVVYIQSADGGAFNSVLQLNTWSINENQTLYFSAIRGLSNGIYQIRIAAYGYISNEFIVTDDPDILSDTCLLQYSMKNNRQRSDTIFMIGGKRRFFDFRVPGGFKDSDITFGCDDEQFTASNGDIVTLYSKESTYHKFTLGSNVGVPARMAEMLNRVFTCNFVYIDGVRYARKEGGVPEPNVLIDGIDSFVYKMTLQKVLTYNVMTESQNQAIIRRVGDIYRSAEVGDENINLLIE